MHIWHLTKINLLLFLLTKGLTCVNAIPNLLETLGKPTSTVAHASIEESLQDGC